MVVVVEEAAVVVVASTEVVVEGTVVVVVASAEVVVLARRAEVVVVGPKVVVVGGSVVAVEVTASVVVVVVGGTETGTVGPACTLWVTGAPRVVVVAGGRVVVVDGTRVLPGLEVAASAAASCALSWRFSARRLATSWRSWATSAGSSAAADTVRLVVVPARLVETGGWLGLGPGWLSPGWLLGVLLGLAGREVPVLGPAGREPAGRELAVLVAAKRGLAGPEVVGGTDVGGTCRAWAAMVLAAALIDFWATAS